MAWRGLLLLLAVGLGAAAADADIPRLLTRTLLRPTLPLLHHATPGASLPDPADIPNVFVGLPTSPPLPAEGTFAPTFGALATFGETGSRFSDVLGLSAVTNDVVVAAVTTGAALLWLRFWTALASRGALDPKVSRKIIHCGSAPLFLALWPLFSDSGTARLFAAAVPLVQVLKLLSAGLSGRSSRRSAISANGVKPEENSDNELVKAISRSGKASEALGGPLIYTLVLTCATVLQWRGSPVGIIAVTQMAAGDGLADIVGRKYGKNSPWPFMPSKSVVGTAAFVIGGFLASGAMLWWFVSSGCVVLPDSDSNSVMGCIIKLLIVSIAAAAIELVPIADDNITVPATSAVLTALLFGCV